MIDYKGYTGVFEYDPELSTFAGHVIDLRDQIYFEGDSVEALQDSMKRAVDHYLEVCEARREEPERPFSGKLNVRLGSHLHRAAAVAAASQGKSLNTWLMDIVERAAATSGSASSPKARQKRPRKQRSSSTQSTGTKK